MKRPSPFGRRPLLHSYAGTADTLNKGISAPRRGVSHTRQDDERKGVTDDVRSENRPIPGQYGIPVAEAPPRAPADRRHILPSPRRTGSSADSPQQTKRKNSLSFSRTDAPADAAPRQGRKNTRTPGPPVRPGLSAVCRFFVTPPAENLPCGHGSPVFLPGFPDTAPARQAAFTDWPGKRLPWRQRESRPACRTDQHDLPQV